MIDAQTARPRSRRLRRSATLLVALVTTGGLTAGPAFASPAAPDAAQQTAGVHVPKDRMAALAAMQPSWNLGNTLDAIPDETSWGNPLATKALFDKIRSEGFRSVRIPVTWYPHESATAPYTIDATYLKRVKQVVDLAQAAGLYAEMNVHHDSWQWISNIATDHDNVMARFNSTWQQIATALKDEPRSLLMESVNEPSFANGTTDAQKKQYMNELNTSFFTIVRKSGGNNKNRLLVLPTQGCTPSDELMNDLSATINSLHDPNLVATVHYYSYWPFSVNIAGTTTYDATTQKDLNDAFARMRTIFTSKGVPVYLGEYGLLSEPNSGTVENGEMLKYYEELGYQARTSHVTSALWDDANFLNRSSLQWREPDLMAMIKQSWTSRSGTAASDNLFLPKSGPITDQTIDLNLNGTRFLTVWNGNAQLRDGPDYKVKDGKLTLFASALTRLAGDRSYGVNSTVELWFSEGVDWKLHIISSDLPVLSDATGTTDGLSVPTQYRGDQLATIESKYTDGTNAGPASWTAFQGWGSSFAPDYAGNATTFTKEFLSSLTDGRTAVLTLHYRSGATGTYKLTRSGSTVTGSAS
ncbi:cellulase family glycosylhydrolase [Kitasatospora sp. NPDC049285]|uniref:cellulase family glycosylhydrolase n=1 Tax=Kitasatospora sp. NPDC049285 TaxID=3157096 RepID=UPI0034422BCD